MLVWPDAGPMAYLRERVLRRTLPKSVAGVLDCYICMGFWVGLGLSAFWWWLDRSPWAWFGGPMTVAVFWLVLRPLGGDDEA